MYSASGLLSALSFVLVATGSFVVPQPARAKTATRAKALREVLMEVFMACERAAEAVKKL
ncbi:hypothetical protein GCM10009744_30480 [Kribbella alba]|uniref:Uncharacterized protein n=1 Tax=Kribbella alba TaxID=190197 RepID=A0ABN2FCZ4_9ACTN